MATGTLFLSEKAKSVLGGDGFELTKEVEKLISNFTSTRVDVGISSSVYASGDVSLNLYDIGNLTGFRVDTMSLAIKFIVSKFFLKRGLPINPFKISVTSQVTVKRQFCFKPT